MDQNKTYYEHCRAIEEALGITIGDSELLNQLVGQARELRHAQPGIIYQTVAKTIIEVLAKPVITPANMADYLSSFFAEFHEEVSLASALDNQWFCCHVTSALSALLLSEAGIGFVQIRGEHIADGRDPYVWVNTRWISGDSGKPRNKTADIYAALVGSKSSRNYDGGTVLVELCAQ